VYAARTLDYTIPSLAECCRLAAWLTINVYLTDMTRGYDDLTLLALPVLVVAHVVVYHVGHEPFLWWGCSVAQSR
jgi:hypothetical protein